MKTIKSPFYINWGVTNKDLIPSQALVNSVGAGIANISSWNKNLTLLDLHVLLAVACEADPDGWTTLKSVRKKLPCSSDYEITRSVNRLTKSPKTILGFLKPGDNAGLLQKSASLTSSREKILRLTTLGYERLNRLLYSMSTSESSPVSFPSRTTTYDFSLHLPIKPQGSSNVKNPPEQMYPSRCLFSVGTSGSGQSLLQLNMVQEAAYKGAAIFFISNSGYNHIWWLFNSIAQNNHRGNACFINGRDEYKQIEPSSVITKKGMCMYMSSWLYDEDYGFSSLLNNLKDIYEGKKNTRVQNVPVVVFINEMYSEWIVKSDELKSVIKSLAEEGVGLFLTSNELKPKSAEFFETIGAQFLFHRTEQESILETAESYGVTEPLDKLELGDCYYLDTDTDDSEPRLVTLEVAEIKMADFVIPSNERA